MAVKHGSRLKSVLKSRPAKRKQLKLLASETSAYGGELLKTRVGRLRGRPLSTRETMHLVLRSTQAKGDWSFRKPRNMKRINRIVEKFSLAYGVRVISMANVGNHLHLQIKLSNRFTYNAFIRAVSGAIALAITGRTRWTRSNDTTNGSRDRSKQKFWDYRPFTRIVSSLRGFLKLRDYIRINQLEGDGYQREDARFMIEVERKFAQSG